MIDEDRVEGFARNVGRQRPDAVGGMAGGTATTQAHDLYGRTIDELRKLTTDRPFGALLAAMAAGMVIGFVTSRG